MFNASLWGRLAAASLGCRVVVAEHSMTGKTRLAERLTNVLLGGVTETVIACAEGQVDALVRGGHQPRKIRVVRNGVDVDRFSRDIDGAKNIRVHLDLPEDAPVVMLVAAHRAEKRHDRFLLLIEQLHSSGVQAWGVMAGGGPLLEQNRSLAAASPCPTGCASRGPSSTCRRPTPRPTWWSSLSDDIETFPLSFLEAQACQVPVVAMDTGGVRETLVHRQTGFVVEQGDLQGMASVVAGLLRDADRRVEVGRAGRRGSRSNCRPRRPCRAT